jgi:hypothetical protein
LVNFRGAGWVRGTLTQPSLRAKRSNPAFLCLVRWIASSLRSSQDGIPNIGGRLQTHLRILAACSTRVFAISIRPKNQKGAGNAGCPKHPQPACKGSKHAVVTTGTPETSGVPCAMVLTAYSVLFPATNSFCHRRRRIEGVSDPVGPTHLRQLDTSNGCQNHTALPSASPVFVKRLRRVWYPSAEALSKTKNSAVRLRAMFAHGRSRPAFILRARRCRGHRIPCPTSVTIAKRPFEEGTGWRELVEMICPTGLAEYFSQKGWTGNEVICLSGRWRSHQADFHPPSSPGLTGRSSIPETSVMESRGRGVLGRPVKPGGDEKKCTHHTPSCDAGSGGVGIGTLSKRAGKLTGR